MARRDEWWTGEEQERYRSGSAPSGCLIGMVALPVLALMSALAGPGRMCIARCRRFCHRR